MSSAGSKGGSISSKYSRICVLRSVVIGHPQRRSEPGQPTFQSVEVAPIVGSRDDAVDARIRAGHRRKQDTEALAGVNASRQADEDPS